MSVQILLENKDEVMRKLNYELLVQPELDQSFGSFEKRLLRKRRGRLAARTNTLTATRDGLTATKITSTKNPPRNIGATWLRAQLGIARAMAPRVIAKLARNVATRWGR